jgi:ATP-dependent DNA ligase
MVNKIFNELAATSSRLEKEGILTANKNNDVLRWACFLALDPFTNFYIRKIPKYKTGIGPYITLQHALDRLFALSTRQVTGNAGIEFLTKVLEELEPEDARVIERVIEKDLRCGVSEATVNKIWPNLVPTYPCMLASGYEDKLVSKINWPANVQLKLDGMRFNAIVKRGTVEFRSRNGKLLNLLGQLEQEFLAIAGNDEVVFDGELNVMDTDSMQFMARQIGNGILSKAQKGTLTLGDAALIHATVWDWIPYADFLTGTCTMPYRMRLNSLFASMDNAAYEKTEYRVGKVHKVWNKNVDNIQQAQEVFEQMLSEGQEGIILKDFLAHWEDKRAKHQIKFKGELECDLMCVDWVEGTGKNAGRLGALVLESSDGAIKVNVGTGFTDHDRDVITKDVIGKVIAIKYNGRIVDTRTGVSSLFLPVFVEVRNDKDTADHSKNVK